jgi:hypothetical protein
MLETPNNQENQQETKRLLGSSETICETFKIFKWRDSPIIIVILCIKIYKYIFLYD